MKHSPENHDDLCPGCMKPPVSHPCPAIVYEIAKETILRQARKIVDLEAENKELKRPLNMAA